MYPAGLFVLRGVQSVLPWPFVRAQCVRVAESDIHKAIEAVLRIERSRLIGGLTGFVRVVGLAEELSQDERVAALAEWPVSGVPRNRGPRSWRQARGGRWTGSGATG